MARIINESKNATLLGAYVVLALLLICKSSYRDAIQLPGNNPNDREMLYDFIVDELSQVEEQHHRVAEYARSLKHQKKHLLAVSHRFIRHSRKLLQSIKSPSMRSGRYAMVPGMIYRHRITLFTHNCWLIKSVRATH